MPVNFVLSDPTRLRYLDPVFALHNQAAVRLVAGGLPAGLQPPAAGAEAAILARLDASGAFRDELGMLAPMGPGRTDSGAT
jgi:adenosylhomocysteinase